MKKKLFVLSLLFLLVSAHIAFVTKVEDSYKKLAISGNGSMVVLPPELLKLVSLEYDGLLADYYFLKSMVFMGATRERKIHPQVKDEEWLYVLDLLNVSTMLDPWFFDPYYFGNAHLTWEGQRIEEANLLLERGSRYRDKDWRLPYYIGFNKFYFLQQNEQAAEQLMEASRRPFSPPLLVSLASRVAYKGRNTENTIAFLEGMLSREDDISVLIELKKRLLCFQSILVLERETVRFRKQFGRPPENLQELVQKGVLPYLPVDPYGGEFYLDAEGAVKTTSDLREMAKKP